MYELLLNYYRIGNLRNQVNHAVVDEPDPNMDLINRRTDSRIELHRELKKFIGIYSRACKCTHKKKEPMMLSSAKMKAFSRHHQLQPLEETPDLTAKNTYCCSFNGKELQINISMFRPEADTEPES